MPGLISIPTRNTPSPKGLVSDDVVADVASVQVPHRSVEKPASVDAISTAQIASVTPLAMMSSSSPLKVANSNRYLFWEQEAGSSILPTPTIHFEPTMAFLSGFLLYSCSC